MSVVAAIECPSGVWMAWDSGLFDEEDHGCDGFDEKGFTLSDELLGVGAIGTSRAAQAARYLWTPPKLPSSDRLIKPWLYKHAIPSLQSLGEKHKLPPVAKDADAWFEGMLCLHGQVHAIYSDWSTNRSPYGYVALGSGGPYVSSSLATTEQWKDPRQRLRAAMRAAIRHCTYLREPFKYQFVPKDE